MERPGKDLLDTMTSDTQLRANLIEFDLEQPRFNFFPSSTQGFYQGFKIDINTPQLV